MDLPKSAMCIGCGYALRGLPVSICPECGRAFDPSDASTFQEPDKPTNWRKWARAPSLIHIITAIMLTLTYLYWSSVPGGLLASLGLGVFLYAIVGLAMAFWLAFDYINRADATLRDRRRAQLDHRRPRSTSKWRWVATPFCLTVFVSALLTSWPMRLRFELSRSALEDTVRNIESGTTPTSLTGTIGLLPIRNITRYEADGIYFQTGTAGFDRVGLDFCSSDEGCQYGKTMLDRRWSVDER